MPSIVSYSIVYRQSYTYTLKVRSVQLQESDKKVLKKKSVRFIGQSEGWIVTPSVTPQITQLSPHDPLGAN